MMRRRHSLSLTALAVALAVVWGFGYVTRVDLGASAAARAVAQAAAHPEVDPIDSCESCHADTHPEVVKNWEMGKHSLNGVKCFVCHGSVTEGFTRTPTTTGCIGCHAPQVETMTTAFMKDKTCFTCHDPHALSPHKVAGGGR